MLTRRTFLAGLLAAAVTAGACSPGSGSVTADPSTPAPSSTSAPVATAAATSSVDEDVRTMLGNLADRYRAAEGAWPGFDPTEHPAVVAFRDGEEVQRVVTINHPDPDALGEATAVELDGLPFAAHLVTDLVDPGSLEAIPSFDFTSQQGGVSSFVLIADPTDAFFDPTTDEYAATYLHELFHRHQILSWVETGFQDIENYPLTADNLALATLEERALAAAMTAPDDDERDLAARRFVALRLQRRSAESAVAELDDAQEAAEGTARWIEHATAGQDDGATYDADNFDRDLQTDLGGVQGVKDTFAFGRFYASGAAVVELLDRLGVDDYPGRIARGEAPATVLAEALSVSADDVDQLVADARSAYDPSAELADQSADAAAIAATEPPVFGEDS